MRPYSAASAFTAKTFESSSKLQSQAMSLVLQGPRPWLEGHLHPRRLHDCRLASEDQLFVYEGAVGRCYRAFCRQTSLGGRFSHQARRHRIEAEVTRQLNTTV